MNLINLTEFNAVLGSLVVGAGLEGETNFPNLPRTNQTPRLEVSYSDGAGDAVGLKGAIVRSAGLISFVYVTPAGVDMRQGYEQLAKLQPYFQFGTRLSLPLCGATVLIKSVPFVRHGYEAGKDWHTPMILKYEAE